MKKRYWIFLCLFFVFFCVDINGVKAEKFNVVYKCDNSNFYCPLSIVDGKLSNKTDYCDVKTTWGDRKARYVGDVSISEASKCYKVEYTCTWNGTDKKYDLVNIKFVKTDATKSDAGEGIICPSKSLIDMCKDYNSENFEKKCPKRPSGATYAKFRGKCDLSYSDAMDYCNGTGDYAIANSKKNSELVDTIKDWAKNGSEGSSDTGLDANETLTCAEVLDTELIELLAGIFRLISVGGVILLIILMGFDFVKAIVSSEDDAVFKAFKDSRNRVIAVIILLLLPVLVNFMISILNNLHFEDYEGKREIKFGNVSECNITK